jgi:hypothetical protein
MRAAAQLAASAAGDIQSLLCLQTDPVKPSHVQGLITCRILCNASLATTRMKTSGFPSMAPAIYDSVDKSPDAEILPRNGTTGAISGASSFKIVSMT